MGTMIPLPPSRQLFAFLLVIPLLLLAAIVAQAQQLDERASGEHYILAFPDTTNNTSDARFPDKMDEHVYLFIYSAVDTKVTITGVGYSRTVTPVAGKFRVVDLLDPTQPAPMPILTDVGRISNGTFQLESQDPIVVYCSIMTRFGAEAFTPIPVESWGMEYYAAGVQGEVGNNVSPAGEFNYNATSKMFPAEITIIAADSNTLVTITPAGRLMNNSWPTTLTLQANQAYQIQSYVDTSNPGSAQPEFAGTLIRSNKPIGVISGNTRAQAEDIQPGLGKNIYKNMLMEWIAPVEQHGRSFVYMPTMDGWQFTGQPNEKPEEKRPEEWVRIYGTNAQGKQSGGSWLDPKSGVATNFTIPPPGKGGYHENRIAVPTAVYFKTDSAAQAFMNTVAVVKFLGTTGFGSNIGAKYDGVGTFMTEMTPREQWVNFAPYYVPTAPGGINHYVSLVTDTASAKRIVFGTTPGQPTGPFNFRYRIKGTDLIWGYQTVAPGIDYYVAGWNPATNSPDTGVRFGGDVRGTHVGHEEYRPGATRKRSDADPSTASAGTGRGGEEILHPSEYEEYLAVADAYPLAPSRVVLGASDSLRIDSPMDCSTMHVHVRAMRDSGVGLKQAGLERVTNAKLLFVTPTNPKDLVATSEAWFDVAAVDPLHDAAATLVIRDRTNKSWRVPYSYQAERADLIPTGKNGDDLDFGAVAFGTPAIQDLFVTNPLSRDITIKDLKTLRGGQNFTIVSPTVPPAIRLKPGEQMVIQVQFTPTEQDKTYDDSLRIILGCAELRIRLLAQEKPAAVDAPDIAGYGLGQNDPNPFHDATSIEFSIPRAGTVRLEIYDLLGRRVATLVDGTMQRGLHSATWTATGVPAGIYYYRLVGENWSGSREMIVR
jgi:hypothetical protein